MKTTSVLVGAAATLLGLVCGLPASSADEPKAATLNTDCCYVEVQADTVRPTTGRGVSLLLYVENRKALHASPIEVSVSIVGTDLCGWDTFEGGLRSFGDLRPGDFCFLEAGIGKLPLGDQTLRVELKTLGRAGCGIPTVDIPIVVGPPDEADQATNALRQQCARDYAEDPTPPKGPRTWKSVYAENQERAFRWWYDKRMDVLLSGHKDRLALLATLSEWIADGTRLEVRSPLFRTRLRRDFVLYDLLGSHVHNASGDSARRDRLPIRKDAPATGLPAGPLRELDAVQAALAQLGDPYLLCEFELHKLQWLSYKNGAADLPEAAARLDDVCKGYPVSARFGHFMLDLYTGRMNVEAYLEWWRPLSGDDSERSGSAEVLPQ